MNVFLWNARARNGQIEATLNHPFPAQVEPKGNQGRDVVIRDAIASSAWRDPIPDVSVCARLAEAQARKIKARIAAKEEEERVKMVAMNKQGLANLGDDNAAKSAAPDADDDNATHATKKKTYRKCLDTFQQFVAPDVATTDDLGSTLPVLNTRRGRGSYDRGAKPDSLSRRHAQPPIPYVRTFTL